jgi:hypothetical protein
LVNDIFLTAAGGRSITSSPEGTPGGPLPRTEHPKGGAADPAFAT